MPLFRNTPNGGREEVPLALFLANISDLPLGERERRVREALALAFPTTYKDGGIDYATLLAVRDVYDDSVVFSRGSDIFSVRYHFDPTTLRVAFRGAPIKVIVKYYEPLDGNENDGDEFDDDAVAAHDQSARGIDRTAEPRWLAGVEKLKKDNPGMDDRKAGETLSLRDPGLWHAYREAIAGERIPRVRQRHNRHTELV
jgi:hypothetical protein